MPAIAPTKSLKAILPPALLCLGLLAFFLDKPFHNDDPLFVWIGQQIRAHPLDFYGFSLNWEGHTQPVSRFFENPPLTSFLLAAVSCVGGFNPIALHTALLPVNLATVIGVALLARRFCGRPRLAAILFVLCPAFLVSATSVMCEPLLICLWVWAIFLWVRGVDRQPALLPLAGAVMLLAILTKFTAICLIPLALLYLFCATVKSPRKFKPLESQGRKARDLKDTLRRRTPWMATLGLIIPVLGALGYQAYTSHRYGTGAFTNAAVYATNARQIIAVPACIKLANTLCFAGGCSAACVILLPLVFKRRVLIASVLLTFALAAWAALHLQPPDGWISGRANTGTGPGFAFFGQYAFWTVGGLGLMALAISPLPRTRRLPPSDRWRDDLFLFAWICGIFFFTAFINWSINARSILPMLPAICIVVVRRSDAVKSLPRFRVALLLLVSAGLALGVTRADYEQAATIEMAAERLSRMAKAMPGNDSADSPTLWCAGHGGFQYYLQAGGAKELEDLCRLVKPGDRIAVPTGAEGSMPGITGVTTLDRIAVGSDRWIAAANLHMGAAFYCSYGYGLPFVFGPTPAETFYLLQASPQTKIHR